MILYTTMPLELVLDGVKETPAPTVELTLGAVKMQIAPVAPGIGRIVRLVQAPLDCYLLPQYEPGRLVSYAAQGTAASVSSGEECYPVPFGSANLCPTVV